MSKVIDPLYYTCVLGGTIGNTGRSKIFKQQQYPALEGLNKTMRNYEFNRQITPLPFKKEGYKKEPLSYIK